MKKLFSFVLALVLVLSLAGCSGGAPASSSTTLPPASPAPESPSSQPESLPDAVSAPTALEKTGKTLRVAALKGPTAMGMVKLMEEAAAGNTANGYEFTLAGSPDEIVGSIIQGEFDVAAVPTNLAATLYNKTQGKEIGRAHV